MSDAGRNVRLYSRIKNRKFPLKGSRPSVPHGTNFFTLAVRESDLVQSGSSWILTVNIRIHFPVEIPVSLAKVEPLPIAGAEYFTGRMPFLCHTANSSKAQKENITSQTE